LSKFDNLYNVITKIKSGALADAGSNYSAKKNGLYDISVREAVRGYDDQEAYEELGKRYGDDLYEL
jgi:hypothetical protein